MRVTRGSLQQSHPLLFSSNRMSLLMDHNLMLSVVLLEKVLIFQTFIEPSLLVLLSSRASRVQHLR